MMSVIVILRVPGNPADLERYAAGAGGEIMQRVAAAGKAAGAVRHSFAGGDNEILVVDEWPDEQSFQAFFAGQPEIADVMRDGGAQGPPEVSVYRTLHTPDQF
jgi:heme-degrading monooxygenase HmoA